MPGSQLPLFAPSSFITDREGDTHSNSRPITADTLTSKTSFGT